MAVQLTTNYQLLAEKFLIDSYGKTYIRIYAKYSDRNTTDKTHKVWYQSRLYYAGNDYIQDGTENAYNTVSGTDAGSSSKKNYNTVSGGRFPKGETVLQTISGTTSALTVTGSAFMKFAGWSGQPEATATGTGTLEAFVVNPTINSATVTNSSTVGTVNYSASVTSGTSNSLTYTWTGLGSSNRTGSSGSVSGLTHNGTYNWTLTVTASDGGTASTSGTVYIAHNAPTLSNVGYSEQRSGNRYTRTIGYDVSYDGTGVGYASHSLVYGTSTAYGSSGTSAATGSRAGFTISNLLPNTTYYWKATETDNGYYAKTSTPLTRSFTTSGIAPTINNVVLARGYTSCQFSPTVSWDINASAPSSGNYTTVYVGTLVNGSVVYTITQSGRGNVEVTGLNSNSTYYYKVTVTDNYGRTSSAYTGQFTTYAYSTVILDVSLDEIKTNALKLRTTFTTDSSVTSNGSIVVRNVSAGTSTTIGSSNISSPWIVNVSNLNPDTDYVFEITVSNSINNASQSVIFSTIMEAPVINNLDIVAIDPFTIQTVVSASINPSKTLTYRFSNNKGSSWSAYQSSPVYTWTNLSDDTEYDICVEVRAAHTSTYSGDTFVYAHGTVSTPPDQASVGLNSNGTWVYGKLWYKQNGNWYKAKKVYIKKDNIWLENNNF